MGGSKWKFIEQAAEDEEKEKNIAREEYRYLKKTISAIRKEKPPCAEVIEKNLAETERKLTSVSVKVIRDLKNMQIQIQQIIQELRKDRTGVFRITPNSRVGIAKFQDLQGEIGSVIDGLNQYHLRAAEETQRLEQELRVMVRDAEHFDEEMPSEESKDFFEQKNRWVRVASLMRTRMRVDLLEWQTLDKDAQKVNKKLSKLLTQYAVPTSAGKTA